MAASPDDVTAWRDRLIQARMSGVREVQDSDGSRVTYRSDAEMRAAISAANDMIAAASQPQPVTSIRFRTSKGL